MRMATWNVNSIRSRIDRLTDWLQRNEIDVLALQESKAKDAQFPYDRLQDLGYAVAHHGLNQWNGVAILSRVGLADVQVGFEGAPAWGEPPTVEARAIGATVGTGEDAVRLWSVYVPNGRHLTDPHMDYKEAWLGALLDRAREWAAPAGPAGASGPDGPAGLPVALCGDWNIAPFDEDVWSMAFYEDKSHVSPRERAAFHAFLEAGFVDVVRPHTPGPGVYTYWDYQQLRFAKRQGMRIDFVLGSASFADRVVGAAIDREERKGTGASDHAPVVVQLESRSGA